MIGGLALRGGAQRFGTELHAEDRWEFSFRLADGRWSLGLRGNWLRRSTEGFSSAQGLGWDGGVRWSGPEGVRVGLALRDWGTDLVAPGPEWRAGLAIPLDGRSTVLVDWIQRPRRQRIAAGMIWHLHPHLTLRGGVHNHPWQWSWGFSLRAKGLQIEYAAESHAALATTHLFSLLLGGR
ncbi:MAG: hypothetical protein KatS3mg115_2168 [Candidatus Poribacteria bacterium]|nr:MAG: hypothetical protein KatS3mg115_2168 [Candidatus Poribacteria bacterium]